MLAYLLYALAPFAVLAAVYGLHRLCLYLEAWGYIDYLHKPTRPRPGSAFSPLQELIQPQIRHVTDVSQRTKIERHLAIPIALLRTAPREIPHPRPAASD
jgi:hypothetical protein